jgi:hypothetical protein
MWVVASAVAVTVVVGAVIAARRDGSPASTRGPSRYVSAAVGLCDAKTAADGGDARSARTAFFNYSHQTLHELARRLEDGHRDSAARLLLAKQAVEADLGRAAAADTARDLVPLIRATGQGIELVEGTRLAPCSTKGVTP